MATLVNRTRGAVVYTRVSTGEQAKEGTSLESQRDACRAKALTLGLPIVAEYEDAGVSGAWLQRPGMMAALADIQTGRADHLICANMSRYSRDTEHQNAILKAITAAGGRIVFCDITFDDTPEGKMMFNFMGGYAEYERNVIAKRTYGGRVSRAEQGIQTARLSSPFGYHIVNRADVLRGDYPADQLGRYRVVEDQARIVRELFAKYAAGTHSLTMLARELNAAGVPTPGGGKCWRVPSLTAMFQNPVYKGVAVFGRFDHKTDEKRLEQIDPRTGRPFVSKHQMTRAPEDTWITFPCPALVSEAVWDRCNEVRGENRVRKGGNPSRVRMLATRVFCPECGTRMIYSGSTRREIKGKVYTSNSLYVCGRYRSTLSHFGKGKAECLPTGYLADPVEGSVVRSVESACQREDWIRALSAEYSQEREQARTGDDARRELAAIDRALKEIGQEETAAVTAQIAGIRAGASPDVYAEVFAGIAARRKDLEDRRGVVSKSVNAKPKGGRGNAAVDVKRILADVRLALTSPHVPGAQKRDILGTVIEKVVPFREGREVGAEVHYLPGLFCTDTFLTMRSVTSGGTASPI